MSQEKTGPNFPLCVSERESCVFAQRPSPIAHRARQRGLTLVEMLIVLLIVTLLLAGVVMGTGQLAGAKLHKSATTITGLIRVAYVRATVTSRSERIVFDLDENKFWLEESEQPMLVQSRDATGTGGADPVT